MKNLTAEQTEKIETFLSSLNIDIDILNLVYIENIDFDSAFDSMRDMIEDNDGFNGEIIYYSNAINYLKEHDPSLTESLSLAQEMGYTPENLNSEILATLLNSQNLVSDFNCLEDEINIFFEELQTKIMEAQEDEQN